MSAITVEFCGEDYTPTDGRLTIGRDADLSIDESQFLHRRFLEITSSDSLWWLSNVGSHLTATVADETGSMQAWLAPGAAMPLVFGRTTVWFTAGGTTYEFDVLLTRPPFLRCDSVRAQDGAVTTGRVTFTPDQLLLIVALCEPVLRRGHRGTGVIPPSADAANRLGWTLTKFNRKLDNVCHKLSAAGVSGLHGSESRLASSRRARLVEYAMAARLVSDADLDLLPAVAPG